MVITSGRCVAVAVLHGNNTSMNQQRQRFSAHGTNPASRPSPQCRVNVSYLYRTSERSSFSSNLLPKESEVPICLKEDLKVKLSGA